MSQGKSTQQSKRSKKTQRRAKKKVRKARNKSKALNKQHAQKAINSFLGDIDIFSDYQFHGNIKWAASDLTRIGLLLSWSEKKNITDAFTETFKRCQRMAITTVHTTYQGLIGALANYTHIFIPLLILQLQQKMQEVGGEFWVVSGFVPIAFDGSRNSASRTQSNERELCSAKGKAKAAQSPSTVTDPKPQAWITLMWHMGLRLPWDWRLGPSDSSERAHVREMVASGSFPENTLFCGDAGFVGYDFWRWIIEQGQHFMVRVGGNVKLIGETLDYQQLEGGEVLCWPKGKQAKQPPLRLRLVKVTIGKTEVYLLTSVLCPKDLPASAMLTIYKMRWGIEIEFRGLKQTLSGQKLRCRNAERLYTELHWSLLAMAVAELLAVREQVANQNNLRESYTPKDRSLAITMRAIYECLDELEDFAPTGGDLFSRLAMAITDGYQRKKSKKARYRPARTKKNKKPTVPPEVRKPNTAERQKLRKTLGNIAA